MKNILILLFVLCCATVIYADDSLDVPATVNSTSQVDSVAVQTNSLYPMSSERKAKLTSYSQFNNIWRFADFFISLGILLLILFTGLSAKLRTYTDKIPNKFFALWAFVILFFALEYLLTLPFNIYRNFLVEGEYGFVNQTFLGWFSEDLLSLGLSMLFGIIPIYFLYKLIKKTKYWWLQFTLGAIPFMIIMMVIAPIFISPLFNKFIDLQDKELKTEIHALAEKAGIQGADIFQVNTSKQSSKVNAYVTGMFNSKRIVLTDNLINNFTTDEIKFVMGHEMGHYVMNHVWKSLPIIIVVLAFVLWFTGLTIQKVIDKYKARFKFDTLSDHASLPLLLIYFSIIMFLFNPITNSISRYHEHQADKYGMEITDVTGEEAAIAFDKLSVYNLADPDPNPFMVFWFYSHPALQDRMAFVRNFRK
ncbi:MAG TPA: M48 family peptidase [candidate division Zixibacteria bacterium]|nr:M48 family peptidase [candidate division Zixibacteria bacterium]